MAAGSDRIDYRHLTTSQNDNSLKWVCNQKICGCPVPRIDTSNFKKTAFFYQFGVLCTRRKLICLKCLISPINENQFSPGIFDPKKKKYTLVIPLDTENK